MSDYTGYDAPQIPTSEVMEMWRKWLTEKELANLTQENQEEPPKKKQGYEFL